MTFNDATTSVLLENVEQLVSEKFPEQTAPLVQTFVAKLYSGMTHDDLHHRNDSDLYGAAINLWNDFETRPDNRPHVQVYNPELSRHGWQSPHTIVELVLRDAPFQVDSIRMALSRLGITAHLMLHQPMHLVRDKQGRLERILSSKDKAQQNRVETAFLIEIDRQPEQQKRDQLRDELLSVVEEVALAVDDWQPMVKRLNEVIKALPGQLKKHDPQEVEENLSFLRWVVNHNFTLMGYRRYHISAVEGDHELVPEHDTSLGLMRNIQHSDGLRLSTLTPTAREEALSQNILVLTKTNHKSRVHRPAYIDYIGIKRFDNKGNVIGEDRFIGLYASSIYNTSAMQIPLIGEKLKRIINASGLEEGSHAYKALLNILETYPRDELIQAREDELLEIGMGVLAMQERDMTRLFVRRDLFGRFFSCMVYVTKERYNTALREKTQRIFQRYFGSEEEVEFTTYFSEGVLARTHYLIRVQNNTMDINVNEIQSNLIEAARSWDDKLEQALSASFGEAEGNRLKNKYRQAFPRGYTEDVIPGSAVADIEQLEALSDDNRLGMLFYRAQEQGQDSNRVRLKLYHRAEPIHLSDVLPMLENLGLRVIGETPYEIDCGEETFWILDFSMLHPRGPLELDASQQRFQQAFAQIWNNQLENDGFNRLVLATPLTGREVSVLRAYARYMRQTGVTFSQAYIEETLSRYPHLACLLFRLFEQRLSPARKQNAKQLQALHQELLDELDKVANLDDDRIIRRYMEMIEATLRTNFYQPAADGAAKPYISFKMAPESISEMPLPLPKFEIFVYSPRVEGVHLRWGKVARGGLRWSDRREDFRTEVLGLVKAQQVKNTVIVPVGAKGGFVCKQLPEGDRAAFLKEGQDCYRLFIRGLLDVTDNIINGEVIPPKNVVRHDEDDYYLVVAADKGTATFSDIANGISAEYGHWLGDAFASGGSVGYDHKKMGITARGAWESVKRHFRELGIDCQSTDFTCVGIGDMAGDVFGNGMLLSKHIRLVGAFNHLHIFIDPEPNAAASYQERQRLFTTPGTTWDDYDKSLISEGGGVFARSAKSISLSPQMKKLLGTQKASLTPTEVIRHLLMAQVDLLWNGGIGTYIKSRRETDTDVGDRANDAVRINGEDLRARVVGEGGNLGCTQLGRIEYASKGGHINTDFTDNVGGVDCSDNEVNIKILLNKLVAEGELTQKHRDQLLYDMTDKVADIVLTNAYRQSQTISITQHRGAQALKEHQRFMHWLEREGSLDRGLEFLPSDEELAERMAANRGLTRPELAILVAYGKMVLKDMLNIPEITNNDYIARLLPASMPEKLVARFGEALMAHPLRGEIIATRLANIMVNDMGCNFANRMLDETGAGIGDIAVSFMIAREVFGLNALLRDIEALDNRVPADLQLRMFYQCRRMVRRATRWFLRNRNRNQGLEDTIAQFKPAYDALGKHLYEVMVDSEVTEHKNQVSRLGEQGVPESLAARVTHMSTLFSALDLAQISHEHQQDIQGAARVYFHLGAELELHWFLDQINQQAVGNHWQALARASFREDLDFQQRSLTSVVLKNCKGKGECDTMLAQWLDEHEQLLNRWRHLLADFKTSGSHEFAQFSVALRELNLLHLNCVNAA
ncbi:NAD-glutamate dehydrogenase [Oceanimonas sp. GK1]|uniref:NAD-glutamate dehydrogenase n=1 Tax=Oceanimonas sp. (strain GK1 / IBRC-M 10197) TaxID=511062 RepID=UPI0002495195|nr:NAD-glutamate dehydrogenase [Oceanimonas sp. GK1]AEY01833.1 NAD-glutamate dehydrogenase [Oceanimonas sp. GK1]